MPAIKVFYFDAAGRAEPIRLALTLGDVPFEDVRMKREEIMEAKAAGKWPFGGLPCMEVDGKMYSQSSALFTYAGKLAGVYSSDSLAALKESEIRDCVTECADMMTSTFAEPDLNRKIAKRKELLEGAMGDKIGRLNAILNATGTKFACREELSTADIAVFTFGNFMSSGLLDGIPTDFLDKFDRIKAVSRQVAENPKIAKWVEDHKKK